MGSPPKETSHSLADAVLSHIFSLERVTLISTDWQQSLVE